MPSELRILFTMQKQTLILVLQTIEDNHFNDTISLIKSNIWIIFYIWMQECG